MKYITGYHALNLPCSLGTTGDWHRFCYDWENPRTKDSDKSIFGEYGIETNRDLSFVGLGKNCKVANHIRACLDIIEDGYLGGIKFFTSDFLDDDPKIVDKMLQQCLLFKSTDKWDDVNSFLNKEKYREWNNVKKRFGA